MTMLAQFAAAAGGVLPAYIEDMFSTYLYTGNGSTQTITNGIDLTGKGGMTWIKARDNGTSGHTVIDTARGARTPIYTNLTQGQADYSPYTTGFTSSGFTVTDDSTGQWGVNGPSGGTYSGNGTYASWTFRKQPKFFDVVTYTGTGGVRTVAHNLGSVPGCIVLKTTAISDPWRVYHRSLGATQGILLNTTQAASTNNTFWNDTAPTSTEFTIGASCNQNGQPYVAYLFAHDAGGFGLSGTENVVSCGSFTPDGSGNATVDLGFEPQWLMMKNSTSANDWYIYDTMRGFSLTSATALYANTSNSDISASFFNPTATGFKVNAVWNGLPTIYIAIRRGPMKVPTLGTTVYNGITRTGTGAVAQVTGVGFPPDLVASGFRNFGGPPTFFDKLRGPLQYLTSSATDAEATRAGTLTAFNQDGFSLGADAFNLINFNTGTFVDWNFRRAPSYFDEVCYTGTGATQTQAHNLGAIPELMIFKQRTGTARSWGVYVAALGNASQLLLNSDSNVGAATTFLNSTSPTASIFTVGSSVLSNQNGSAIVAYLFATCAGVSKVGSYTGTGTTQAINCGFTAGARFVLIKRTDSTGDWYVWDSARGIVAGNDPYLLMNSTAAEVTGTDYVDTSATGFELTSTAPAAINASGGSYIFLAVA